MITIQITSLIIGFIVGVIAGLCGALYGMFKDGGAYCQGFFDGWDSQRKFEKEKEVKE